MTTMRPNAARMQEALAFVESHPGATMRTVIAHVLERDASEKPASGDLIARQETRAYRQARSVVERIVKDRHVRQTPDLALHPWDPKRKAYAEALERALFAAPGATNAAEHALLSQLACKAWLAAGDDNRARTLFLLGDSSS